MRKSKLYDVLLPKTSRLVSLIPTIALICLTKTTSINAGTDWCNVPHTRDIWSRRDDYHYLENDLCDVQNQYEKLIAQVNTQLSTMTVKLDETTGKLDRYMNTTNLILNDLQNNIFEEIKSIPDLKQLEDYINAQVDAQIDSLKLEMKRDLIRSLRMQLIQDGKEAEAKSDNPKATTKDEL